MATSAIHLLAIWIGFLSIISTVYAARPCKTLAIISSYSFSINSQDPNPNPNPNPDFYSHPYVTVLTIRRLNPYFVQPRFINRRGRFPAVDYVNPVQVQRPQFSLPSVSENLNSLKERTRDILGVVVALLFGVGCGALTAATTYLFWAVFANRSDEDYESDGHDDASPKKMGYVKIPEPVKDVKEAA